MTEEETLKKTLNENRPTLSEREQKKFIAEALALRANLKRRKTQQQERTKSCTHSK